MNDETAPLLEIRNLVKYFPIRAGVAQREVGHIHAVDGVSLAIDEGETLGLVGESGSGKSTLGRCVVRLLKPDSGEILFRGQPIEKLGARKLRPLRRDIQMVFQDPYASLNPRKRVGSIIGTPLRIHKMGDRDARHKRVNELLETVGLSPEHYNRFPHEFSGGQRQRIGLARALAVNPALLIADEPVSALDVSIQAQMINLLTSLQRQFNLTYLVIAHDLAVVRHVSDRIAVMYLGQIVEVSPAADLYDKPLHPYTISLLSAVPIPDPDLAHERESILLAGDLPSPANPPKACRFHTRCPYVQPTRCRDEEPELREIEPGHVAKCHWAEDIQAGKIKPREVKATEVAEQVAETPAEAAARGPG